MQTNLINAVKILFFSVVLLPSLEGNENIFYIAY